MTQLLEKALAEAGKLSEIEQNMLAKWLLNEITSEKRWDKAFSGSESALETLADEALRERRSVSARLSQ